MNRLVTLILLVFIQFSQQEIIDKPMYVPINSLRQSDICSVMSVALPLATDSARKGYLDHHHSRRTMLYYLLSIKLTPNNDRLLQLINNCSSTFQWSVVEDSYRQLSNEIEPYQKQYKAESLGQYWELKVPNNVPKVVQSRKYIPEYRSNGFQSNELKIYWNYDQIQTLTFCSAYNPKTDGDARLALLNSPVQTRKHSGKVLYVKQGIETAVFHVPPNKQVIVLDFADERMPGGYYLEGATTQEEFILFNSDGYRALLDLKYTMMNGGYMLPEFGVAYIKRVRFFRNNLKEERLTDLIVAACYDLTLREGLYKLPSIEDKGDIRARTLQKFQALIASAVANTEGDGSNTYLLLGPIGTGAFRNDIKMIAGLFSEVLNNLLMHSNGPIRHAFDQIWFVSTGDLGYFKMIFEKSS